MASVRSSQLIAIHLHSTGKCPNLANNGLSGHVAGTSAPPPRADIHWPMSGFVLFSSALPPGADLPGGAPVRLILTQC